MSKNIYAELNDRSKQIFKSVVETYLKTGSPSGSETILKFDGKRLCRNGDNSQCYCSSDILVLPWTFL